MGCVKAHSSNGLSDSKESDLSKVDRFGLPTLDSKRFIKNDTPEIADADFYTDLESFRALKNKGQYGRYFSYNWLMRWYRKPTPGTAGYSVPVYGGTTNCYGSAYGGYGSAFGSSNCYSTPGYSFQVPGTAADPGGPMQKTLTFIVDCVDKTQQFDKGKWKKWPGTANELICSRIDKLKEGGEI